MDYYSILGVAKNASDKELKSAYKKLSMQHHPDRTGGSDEKFKQVNEAYSTLKDPRKRQEYDNPPQQQYSQGFGPNGFQGTGGFEDIFSNMFGAGQQRRQQQIRADITLGIEINIEDVFNGITRYITYRLSNGQEETVEIKIPQGAKHGDRIRYSGMGDISPNRTRGDLYLHIKELVSREWQREGLNVYHSKQVNVFDLLLGCVIIVRTPEGKNVKVNVRKGTDPGTTLSIPGYGITSSRRGQKGNLFIIIKADVPNIQDEDILNKIEDIKNGIS